MRLLSLDRSCKGLVMCSRVKPTSICTRASLEILHLTQNLVGAGKELPYVTPSSTTCDSGKPCKTMSRISIRYVGLHLIVVDTWSP